MADLFSTDGLMVNEKNSAPDEDMEGEIVVKKLGLLPHHGDVVLDAVIFQWHVRDTK